MKRNILALAAMALITCPFFMSCSNDPEVDSVPPSFKEVVINPTHPAKGDTVKATIKFLSEGKKWYKVAYSWTLVRSGQKNDYFISKSESSVGQTEPTFTFVVPDTLGMYTLQVHMGSAQASTLFPGNSLYASTSIQNGSIRFEVTE